MGPVYTVCVCVCVCLHVCVCMCVYMCVVPVRAEMLFGVVAVHGAEAGKAAVNQSGAGV
jgi:hypothetical protein